MGSDPTENTTWQQRKSAQTRERVLQATIDCIYELGYGLTTTDKVATRAKVSRGAMLHHFPNRRELIIAAVRYLNEQRLENFLREEEQIQQKGEPSRIGAGIDVYWKQLSSPLFVVFQELQVLARTDTELREALDAALADYDTAWRSVAERVFPDLIASKQHELANLVTMYLCEGMAMFRAQQLGATASSHPTSLDSKGNSNETMVLEVLKKFLRASYSDVRPLESAEAKTADSATANKSTAINAATTRPAKNRQR